MSELLDNLMSICSKVETPTSTLAFSGGMDSLLLALCLRKFTDLRCVVVGTPSSEDVIHARKLKSTLDLNLDVIELTQQRYIRIAKTIAPILNTSDPMKMNLSVVMTAVMEDTKTKTLYVGHGADEIFLGYRKYVNAEKGEIEALRSADLKRLLEVDLPEVVVVVAQIAEGARLNATGPQLA